MNKIHEGDPSRSGTKYWTSHSWKKKYWVWLSKYYWDEDKERDHQTINQFFDPMDQSMA